MIKIIHVIFFLLKSQILKRIFIGARKIVILKIRNLKSGIALHKNNACNDYTIPPQILRKDKIQTSKQTEREGTKVIPTAQLPLQQKRLQPTCHLHMVIHC